ncbi:MAG: IscS subfamily cysteine desulfurase [Planctomycetes bacterium RBG_16_64_12]|nr:MAG: IscS subfamily cysteine desulfurase [Planctomycetes bacterium RBG_16_64_12]
MPQRAVYMDNHATTRVDPRVVEAMLPYFTETFGNAASTTHEFGFKAREAVVAARESIAAGIGARAKEIVFTSGATESNNLAIRGVVDSPRRKGKHLISVATEHPAVLDPLKKLGGRGYDVTYLPVIQAPDERAGCILPDQVAEAIRDDTLLVSVMLANNEIGVLQPLEEIGRISKERGVLLHTDATQAVGKIPVDVQRLGVDLLSFSAHKIYGPKGVGVLYTRRRAPFVRLEPLIFGGGHEHGLRSGTLNVPGIVGFARALELCLEEMSAESRRLRALRDRLYEGLAAAVPDVQINGPALSLSHLRLPGNLNVSFPNVDGEALLMSTPGVAVSSGSACTSAKPEPSHVLRALGIGDDLTRGSLRFGLGRFNTAEDVELVIGAISESVTRLRRMSGLPMLRPEI